MIEVRGLSKHYRIAKRKPGLLGAIQGLFIRKYTSKKAVDDISFTIASGEVVGYIGSNGAGKSTTIKMLSGILTPTSGDVLVNGIVPYRERQKNAKKIGAVFGQRTQLMWDLAPRESYDLLKHIYQIPEAIYQKNLHEMTEKLQLHSLLDIPVRQLSLGQKMRCEFVAAFLHDPAVVYLDEPTIGLDVAAKSRIRSFIKQMNEEKGTTIILTTHDMQDIEELCRRIIIIDNGQILYDGDLHAVKNSFLHEHVISFELDEEKEEILIPGELEGLVTYIPEEGNSNKLTLSFHPETISAAQVIAAVLHHYRVRDVSIAEPKIESIVQEIYERGA